MKPFEGKSALITGGSSGIGLALAKQLAGAGAHIIIVARDDKKLQLARQEILSARQDSSQRVESISIDIADLQQVASSLGTIPAPDYLFNNAGVAQPGLFAEMDLSLFSWMMDINYFGTVHVTKTLLPGMILRGSGHIINFSSITGFHGIYGYSAYGPSKFAIRGLSDVLRAELAPHHIRVSVVFPPDTNTPQLEYENQFKPDILVELDKLNKVQEPAKVARAVLQGVARGSYIITPGFDSTFFYHLNNLLGNLSYRVMDLMLANARRQARTAKR